MHVLSAPPAFVLSQDQTLHQRFRLARSEQTLLRLFGIRVDQFPYTAQRRTRCLPGARKLPACHGAPCSSTPQHPGCQTSRGLQTAHGIRASFTRPAAFVLPSVVRPPLQRALQANPAGRFRQPLVRDFFSNFLRGQPSVNPFNLHHLPNFVKGRIRLFRHPAHPPSPFRR